MKRLAYIDALRGYAILGVIAVHASQFVPGLEGPLRALADQGARGVQLFFVVSALTLMLSWNHRGDGTLPFYIRRLFRIAPMFWLAVIVSVLLARAGLSYYTSGAIGWAHILATAAFLHAFHPDAITSVVPGGWSIAVEMTFYGLFPLLVLALRTWQVTALALVASICVAGLLNIAVQFVAPDSGPRMAEFLYLWFPTQFPAFLAGILVFHLLHAFSHRLPRIVLRAGLAASLAIMIAVPFVGSSLKVFHVAYILAFGLCAFCLAQGVGRLLVNAPIEYVGKISYSAYFWHFIVLEGIAGTGAHQLAVVNSLPAWAHYLLLFAVVAAATMLASSVTYHLIEAPMISMGRRIGRKIPAPGPTAAAA